MLIKKNVGTRPRPKQRTPEEQRRHRAEQAARAIKAGRGNWDANWDRIARCFTGCGSADGATTFAHRLGLAMVPAHLLGAAFPPAEPAPEPPAPTESSLPDTAAA